MTWPGHGEPMDPNPPATAYPQPGYPPAFAPYGYPPYGYPPNGYAPYGYAPNGYPPYGYPPHGRPVSAADVRPGVATASAVLGFITAGLLILAGLLLFLGAAIANDVEDSFNSGTHIGLELVLDGVVNLVAGGLLIGGGVLLVGRNGRGRVLLSVGGGIVLAAALYWVVRFTDISSDSWVFDAGLFVVLTVITLAFAWSTTVTRWLQNASRT